MSQSAVTEKRVSDIRLLVMSTDHAVVRRIASFLENFPVKVLRARSGEAAQQFFASIPIDIAITDDSCATVFSALQRYHSDAVCWQISAQMNERHEHANRTFLAPVDLFVLERALRDALDLPLETIDRPLRPEAATAHP